METIDIGQMGKDKADKVFEKINNKTYMNFQVCRAPMPGGICVSISSEYDAPREEIIGMLLFVMAGEL